MDFVHYKPLSARRESRSRAKPSTKAAPGPAAAAEPAAESSAPQTQPTALPTAAPAKVMGGTTAPAEVEEVDTASRPRLTPDQVWQLEQHFLAHPKPSNQTKRELAEATNLTLARVANWFQNRRAKAKQQKRLEEVELCQSLELTDRRAWTLPTSTASFAAPVAAIQVPRPAQMVMPFACGVATAEADTACYDFSAAVHAVSTGNGPSVMAPTLLAPSDSFYGASSERALPATAGTDSALFPNSLCGQAIQEAPYSAATTQSPWTAEAHQPPFIWQDAYAQPSPYAQQVSLAEYSFAPSAPSTTSIASSSWPSEFISCTEPNFPAQHAAMPQPDTLRRPSLLAEGLSPTSSSFAVSEQNQVSVKPKVSPTVPAATDPFASETSATPSYLSVSAEGDASTAAPTAPVPTPAHSPSPLAGGLAARRRRPRPAMLGQAALHSSPATGSSVVMSPTFRGGISPCASSPARNSRSASYTTNQDRGRVRKSKSSSLQRSPLHVATFADADVSYGMPADSVAGHTAPAAPAMPTARNVSPLTPKSASEHSGSLLCGAVSDGGVGEWMGLYAGSGCAGGSSSVSGNAYSVPMSLQSSLTSPPITPKELRQPMDYHPSATGFFDGAGASASHDVLSASSVSLPDEIAFSPQSNTFDWPINMSQPAYTGMDLNGCFNNFDLSQSAPTEGEWKPRQQPSHQQQAAVQQPCRNVGGRASLGNHHHHHIELEFPVAAANAVRHASLSAARPAQAAKPPKHYIFSNLTPADY